MGVDVSKCLICGATTDLTVEHVIPQALWRRFHIDPDSTVDDVRKTRTTLCRECNSAGSSIHNRPDMMDLIELGAPINAKTLQHIADWAFWIVLLLGLAQGGGIFSEDEARSLLRRRFVDKANTSLPKGTRIYLGLARTLESRPGPLVPSYAVVRSADASVRRKLLGEPVLLSVSTGQPMQVSQPIGIGSVVILVLPSTESSGPKHVARLDLIVNAQGLMRVHPMPSSVPMFEEGNYDFEALRNLFVPPPFGNDNSLLPRSMRHLLDLFQAKPPIEPSV